MAISNNSTLNPLMNCYSAYRSYSPLEIDNLKNQTEDLNAYEREQRAREHVVHSETVVELKSKINKFKTAARRAGREVVKIKYEKCPECNEILDNSCEVLDQGLALCQICKARL